MQQRRQRLKQHRGRACERRSTDDEIRDVSIPRRPGSFRILRMGHRGRSVREFATSRDPRWLATFLYNIKLGTTDDANRVAGQPKQHRLSARYNRDMRGLRMGQVLTENSSGIYLLPPRFWSLNFH